MLGLKSVGQQGGSSLLTAPGGYCCLVRKIHGTKLSCRRIQTHHCTRHTYGSNTLIRVLAGTTKHCLAMNYLLHHQKQQAIRRSRSVMIVTWLKTGRTEKLMYFS
jgi:hypothetical protein